VTLIVLVVGAYLAFEQYQVARIARLVRESFTKGQYEAARSPLSRWLMKRPRAA
jgi:hypothetical protein